MSFERGLMLYNHIKMHIKNNIRFLFYCFILALASAGCCCGRWGTAKEIRYKIFSKEDDNHDTLLFQAVRKGNVQLCVNLVQNGANIYELHKKGNYTVLHLAINQYNSNTTNSDLKQLYEKLIVELIKLGGVRLLNARDAQGYTPLHYTVYFKEHGLFSYLLKQEGIDVNAQDSMNNTALHGAVKEEATISFVKELLAYKDINVNLKNAYGQTPLHIAAYHCDNAADGLEIAQLLWTRKDIDRNVQDQYDKRPLGIDFVSETKKIFRCFRPECARAKKRWHHPFYCAH